jgi:DNA transformation protein
MSDFANFVVEMFEAFGKVQAKRMFGGHGIFHDGLMIGLIADDELYLKADAQAAEKFKALGLPAFEYNKNGKVMAMSYYRAPEEVLERQDMATEWARDAYEAALRSKSPKKAKKPKKSKTPETTKKAGRS